MGLYFLLKEIKALECSELLGEASWEDVKRMCAEYRGGGYSDWYLPTKEELNWIYVNLRKTGKIAGDTLYWSSSSSSDDDAWLQDFKEGGRGNPSKNYAGSVRAVRAFNTSTL